ncbi:MAG: S41 family peptidase [Bellilinea sp.]|nr:S41 family peptidase [Bellilinea sp.]
MNSKIIRTILVLLVLGLLMGLSFSIGLAAGISLPSTVSLPSLPFISANPVVATPSSTQTTIDRETLFKPFWQAWDLVHENYVDQPVDDQLLMQGAIRGMLEALGDPYSGYLTSDEYQQANAPLRGEYEGIGAWVDTSGKYLTIISPMEGSPAEKAGLKAGDQIIAVDGEDVTALDPRLVLRRVLGPAGTTVRLTILREGTESPFEVSIVRQKITLETVSAKMLDNNIAYIKITQFGERTDRDLRTKLRELLRNNPAGLILDLRNNPGGYLNTAINITSQFIGNGIIMIEQYGNGEKVSYQARPGGLATDIPLVVLVNEGSASASEITAGAIQDRGRGLLVGTKTFGKGTVQTWRQLQDNAGAVKITIARWLTPNERQINGEGLMPDVVVEMTEEDQKANRDPQLEKAVELLLTRQVPVQTNK